MTRASIRGGPLLAVAALVLLAGLGAGAALGWDADDLEVLLVTGSCPGCDLSGAELTGANLQGADLSGADLSGASLYLTYLTGADLSGAELSGADLTRADLADADLTGAVTDANTICPDETSGPCDW